MRADLRVVTDGALPYLLSVPPGPTPPEGWPVLCFLHGYDEGPPAPLLDGLTRHGPLRPGSSALATEAFVVVAPQLPLRGDRWHRYAGAVREIVEGVQAAHGDRGRTCLTGFSFGGNGVFDLALGQAGFWSALWPVDPTRVPGADPARPIWLSVGQVARRLTGAFVEGLGLQPAGPAAEAGGSERLYLDEGLDHVGSAASAYGDARIYRWLLARRL